jgi:hypothetical protein
VNLLSPKEEEKTQEKKVKNTVIQDDTTQSEVYETPVTNDTIYIYYEECPRNANKQYIRNGKKDILKLDVFDRVTDSIRLFNLNPIAIDSIVYRDITITQIKDKPKFTLNGPTTTGELLQEIKSMVEN